VREGGRGGARRRRRKRFTQEVRAHLDDGVEEGEELVVLGRVHGVAAHARVAVDDARVDDAEESLLVLEVEAVVVLHVEQLARQVVRVQDLVRLDRLDGVGHLVRVHPEGDLDRLEVRLDVLELPVGRGGGRV